MATTEEETAARTVAAVDFLKVTEQAAIASARWLGRGERNSADQAAVDAMRRELGEMPITGTVVIGEGQKDEAPELYAGEVLGRGGMRCEIAVDPLEGTDLVARGDIGAVAICAIGKPGGIMSAPDIYMQKLVVGATAKGRVSIEAPIAETLEIVALWYGRRVQDLTTIILDRPRHEELIDEIRAAGARIRLIPDGDITASLSVAVSGTGDHLYAGMGGSTRASSRRRRSSASRRDPGQDGPARRGRPPQDGRFRHGQPGNGADDPRPRPRAAVRHRHRRHGRRAAEGGALLRRRGANALDRDGLGWATRCASSTRCTCSAPPSSARSACRRITVSEPEFPFPFAFGEGAGEEFKERLKELMRAQREAFEEVQAESGGQLAAVDRWQVIQQAVLLASAALRAMEPRPSPDEAADAMGLLFARSMAALQGALRPTP